MKAVFINHSDSLGGASTVTRRLAAALRDNCGIDASMLVTRALCPDAHVTVAAPRWRSRLPFLAEHLRIFAANGFNRRDLFKASIATDGLPLSRHRLVHEADVVVLNWVNQGMLSLREIERIAAVKPVVWTMHDEWNYTGLCHHACDCPGFRSGCGNCPLLHGRASASDLSAVTFRRKAQLYGAADIRFVAVSRWLAARAAESPLMQGRHIAVIPNTYEPVEAAPLDRAAHGLPGCRRLVTVCAARLDDPVKGLSDAFAALNACADMGVHAVLVGEIRHPEILSQLQVPYTHIDHITDRSRLQAIFASSDALLSSSVRESFGATLLEAQAAGTTPVAYTHDGRADMITDGVTGYAAAAHTPGALAAALRRALVGPLDPAALRRAAERFSPAAVAAAYVRLFDSIRAG